MASRKPNEIYCAHCDQFGHWASQCPNQHQPAKVSKRAVELPTQEHVETVAVVSGVKSIEERLAELESRVEKLESRKKYQREYMARKRAEEKKDG